MAPQRMAGWSGTVSQQEGLADWGAERDPPVVRWAEAALRVVMLIAVGLVGGMLLRGGL